MFGKSAGPSPSLRRFPRRTSRKTRGARISLPAPTDGATDDTLLLPLERRFRWHRFWDSGHLWTDSMD